jgi:hypothetical protein
MPPEEVREFYGVGFRRAKAIRFGLGIALCLYLLESMASSTVDGIIELYMVIVVLFIGFLGFGFVRSFQVGIRLTDEGVEARTTYSTRTWPWDTIKRARAHDRAVMQSQLVGSFMVIARREERTRIYPILDLTNGRDARIYGLQLVTADLESSSWIDNAVIEINRIVAARRGDPDPSTPRPR